MKLLRPLVFPSAARPCKLVFHGELLHTLHTDERIDWRLKRHVDAAADWPRTNFDLDATTIQTKMIQLAIPEYVSPTSGAICSRRFATETSAAFQL